MLNKRIKFALGGAAIVVAVVYLMITGMTGSSTYYLTVDEAAATEALGGTDIVRVKGTVRHGSVQWNATELRLTFILGNGEHQLPVQYHGVVPDLFSEDREIIVEGRLTPAGIAAESLLASCPSKYESQEVAAHRSE